MKGFSVTLLLSLVATQAFAQSQFDQLHQIEVQQQQVDAAQQADYQRQVSAAQAKAAASEATNRRNRLAAQKHAAEQTAAERRAKDQENTRLRTRAEIAEDEDRALDIEERKLRLQALKAKTDRSNDFIDAELHNSAAKTDVIQSNADATRNVSSGAKALLEDSGKAEVNRSTKWFGNN
ncbi:hypothetical protein PS870_06411 [Pseudomonas fluorescens]|uniref:DUF5384 family protein n=1 Tax=Pseudomonas fluorescens TaxID=294 RepID=A0A5E7QHF5_PSEFL|nr:DUF5384 family protein [Pseudomonas fluorescens]VVP61672.1 hypothetical protein PS870_06411 [Pseudomonas fluorescens]